MKTLSSSVVLRFAFALACLGMSAGGRAGAPGAYLVPTQLLFPDTTVGEQSAPMAVQFTNPANEGVQYQVTNVSIIGPDAVHFTIVNDQCTGVVVAPGLNCTILVASAPTTIGSKIANLAVNFTEGAGAGYQLLDPMRGEGIPAPTVAASLPATGPSALALAVFGLLVTAWYGRRRLQG